ncbi:response regulator transcription factor [Qipengyuania sp.]|uniref:response regulator transcription factor n=1 Tax=Qipengyuania sp. TaxID=2004515 RepID=UPI003AF6DB49
MPKILIADDDDILLDLVRVRLESAGHTVVVAKDGQAALDMLDETSPDAVILDAMMPVLGGQEVLQKIRSNPELTSLPIMMLTARKGEDDVVAFLKSGANEYLPKPFMPQELLLRLDMMLRNASRGI